MNRREYLSIAAASALGSLTGCVSASTPKDREAGASTGSPSTSDPALPVSDSELYRALPRNEIPAIVEPAFAADWEGLSITVASAPLRESVEPRLSAGSRVIGINRGNQPRAYPLSVLSWHEVVNETLDEPVLVTYCPLCGSGVVARRSVGGLETVFGVSGLLWNDNLVMYDRLTDSLWSQLHATAIRGPRTGETLSLLPSAFTTWESWRTKRPDTEVLLPPPYSNTVRGADATENYTLNPYLAYTSSGSVGLGPTEFDDNRVPPKMPVIGVTTGDVSKAYPLEVVERQRVINDTVGPVPIVVAISADQSLVAYHRRVDGRTLWFQDAGESMIRGGRSRWEIVTGRAIDGSYAGTWLRRANNRSPMFWFAWASLNPGSQVYGR